jgi:SAM-dependent methyltransferase
VLTAPARVLHVAPEPCIGERLAAQPTIDYLSADLDASRAMVGMDLTHIELPDASFDVILASHVLEHIPDDVSAMRELRRVLRPGGRAILAVPMRAVTSEDLSITDPEERRRVYGQDDHVRAYGRDGVFEQRLRAAGFDVTSDPMIQEMDPALKRRYRLSSGTLESVGVERYEPIFCCTFGVPAVPSPPTILRNATVQDGRVLVSWTAPESNGGSPVTGYVVTPYEGYAPLESVVFESTATTQAITGLSAASTYRFRVRAVNGIGRSDYSAASNPVTIQAL